jgi:hypothetical protein
MYCYFSYIILNHFRLVFINHSGKTCELSHILGLVVTFMQHENTACLLLVFTIACGVLLWLVVESLLFGLCYGLRYFTKTFVVTGLLMEYLVKIHE